LSEHCGISLTKFSFAVCTKDCIFDFRNHLEQNGSKALTVNVRIAAIRAYLNYVADIDVAVQSIALSVSKIPPRKCVKEEKIILSEEALAVILNAPPRTKMGLRDRTIMVVLYDSAVRLNELLSVKISDMMLEVEYYFTAKARKNAALF
jgi:site-specific recombinase XerD